MNYQDKLKQEKSEFDPQAWQAFQALRNERTAGAKTPSATLEGRKKKRILLLLLLLGVAIALGLITYLYLTNQVTPPISQQEIIQQNDLPEESSNTYAPVAAVDPPVEIDAATGNSQRSLSNQKLPEAQVRTGKSDRGFSTKDQQYSTSNLSTPAAMTNRTPPNSRKNDLPTLLKPTSTASTTTTGSPTTSPKDTREEQAIIAATALVITEPLPSPPIDLLEEKLLKDDLPMLGTSSKFSRTNRFILQANLGWGQTNWSNPFQGNFGFARSQIRGPYGQLSVLYPLNRLVSVGVAGGYYQGEDQVVHRDNLKESDQRITLLGQVELQLIRHPRFALGLTLGGGLEHSNYSFASLAVDTNGNASRLLDPIQESIMTFQLQLNTTYRFNAQTTLGAFANAFTSNNGFYGYGLVLQRNF
jgi:hypothetical protein